MSSSQTNRLAGRRAVITGGVSGIGLATAIRFAQEGAEVAVIDIREGTDRPAASATNPLFSHFTADVANPAEVEDVFQEIDIQLGGIDILVANAGISCRTSFLHIPFEQWRAVLATNLDGVFLCAQQAAKRMMNNPHGGVILATASTNGLTAHRHYADYNASKAGVILLMRTIALELAPKVRANAVCPGYVSTPMQMAEYTDAMIEEVNAHIPLRRHADPSEVAALFTFLASDDAQYLTGQSIPIDGGELA